MPASPDNLIAQAAHLLREKAGVAEGCAIACTKSIAVAGGLGGGSADAAATLRSLGTLWSVRVDEDSLLELAASLGADVPFALRGGTALATGTGRTLSWLPGPPRHWVVLVPLASSDDLKTGHMYALLEPGDFTDGSAVQRQAEAIRSGQLSYGEVQSAFARRAAERWPATAKALALLGDLAAEAVSVAGTGPSVFGLYPKREPAIAALQRVRAEGLPGRLCRFVVRAHGL
jgi:4-diphosphocytidyl-2-C-methyl-D-erythritol kinase